MTILRQNIITIVPLFLVLGILYAIVSHSLQVKEFNWVLEQESAAVGSTIHDFIQHDFVTYFTVNENGQLDVTNQTVRVFDRLITQPDVYAIIVSDFNGNRLYERSEHPANHTVLDLLNFDLQKVRNQELSYSSELFSYSEPPILVVDTWVGPDNASEQGTIIRVIKSGSHYADIRSGMLRWLKIEIGAALVTGLILSLLLTLIIRRRITALHRQSEEYIKGNSLDSLAESPISEFNDLGSTLMIMMNVLHKNVDWYRKNIIKNEQVRSAKEIAANFKARTRNRYSETFQNRQIICDSIGNGSAGHFHAVVRRDNSRVIYTGSVQFEDQVEAALVSDGISRLITRLSEKLNDDELAERFSRQYSKFKVRCKQVKLEGDGTVRVSEFRDGEKISSENIDVQGKQVFIHDFSANISRKINGFCRLAGELAFVELYEDIMKIAEGHEEGILVGISQVKP